MICAMIGSLFTVLTILLIVQYACPVHCPVNSGADGWKKVSFENLYSKAVRELVVDEVLISQRARQQNLMFQRVRDEGFQVSNQIGYYPSYGVGYLPARKNAADVMGRTGK